MKAMACVARLLAALGGMALLASGCSSLKEGECKRDSHCASKGKEMQVCYKEPAEAEVGKCMSVREAKEFLARHEKKKSGKCEDKDGDGAKAGDACDGPPSSLDCDDNDPKVKPGMPELCDAIDNNCDPLGLINEGLKDCVGTVLGGKTDPVIQFMITIPAGVKAGPGGGVLVADQHQIYRLGPSGKAERLAGSEKPGNDNKKGKFARFDQPRGLVLDKDGSIFVVDSGNHCVRKLGPDGEASSYAGLCSSEADEAGKDADGVGEAARFWSPIDAALDPEGNLLVLDMYNAKIKRVTRDRKVTTVAGAGGKEVDGMVEFGHGNGPALKARFNEPAALAVAPDGAVYVADQKNNCIRVWKGGQVSDFAGVCEVGASKGGYADGAAAQAKFKQPQGVTLGPDGTLWVADFGNHCIRAVKDGKVSTAAGKCGQPGYYDGPAREALFNGPMTVSAGPDGAVWIVDQGNYRIRRFIP
jgi:DNA-binding beta-propeller fold protein YncE